MVFLRRICSSRPGDGEQRGQSLAALTAHGRGLGCFQPCHGSLSCVKTNSVSFASAQVRKLNRSVCFSFPHEVGYFVGTPFMARHCVSKQVGRHDAVCQGCPRRVFLARPSWGPRKAGWLCGERRSSVVIELSCLHGSERYQSDLFVDLEHYMTFFSSTTDEEDLLKTMKKIGDELKGIKQILSAQSANEEDSE